MVPTAPTVDEITSNINQNAPQNHYSPTSTRTSPPVISQTSTSWMSLIRASLAAQGITGEAQDSILASWRDGTRKQYCTYITAWLKYCSDCNISQVNPKLQQVLHFLTLQSKRVGYSAVATAQSALSSFIKVDGVKVGDHPLVARFITGLLFNQKPALSRYSETWDPQIVLNHLKTFPAIDDLSLKQLTLKLVMLMALLSAERVQTLQSLSLEEMSTLPGKYVFRISSVLKQTTAKGGQNRHLLPITFHSYPPDKRLCIVELLSTYLKRTAPLRKETKQLLICHAEPHGPASRDTISRWIKQTMKDV